MSLTVKHLNGDTTFLLTFSPPGRPIQRYSSIGSFTVLVDPWLSGPSTMWHPKFLLSKHTAPSCIQDLSEIPEPNLVIISQDKPDHCHEPTLRQLDPLSPVTTILAEPAAYKKIQKMKHFDPMRLHALRPFSPKNLDSVIRFFIPPMVAGGNPGEATISFIPAKVDVAGVHNAIGITYRSPSPVESPSRPLSPTSPYHRVTFSRNNDLDHRNLNSSPPMTPPESPAHSSDTNQDNVPNRTFTASTSTSNPSDTFSSPNNLSISSVSSVSSYVRPVRQREKTLSCIYSPHGVDYNLIRPYASSHLISAAALPLTLLLHSFDRVNNPWWMGGNVAAGLPGGVEIAQNLMAKCWVSAHDEDKENSGISVKNVTKRKYTIEEVASFFLKEGGGGSTRVLNLAPGEEINLKE